MLFLLFSRLVRMFCQYFLRGLTALLLSATLFLGSVQAQFDGNPPRPDDKKKDPVAEAIRNRQPPAPQYALALLATILVLVIACKPSRHVS